MKKLKLLSLVLIIGLTMNSCADSQDNLSLETQEETQTEVDTSTLIDFKGLPVSHRFSTPVEELEEEHNYTALKTLYNKSLKESALKKGISLKTEEQEVPDAEILIEAAEKRLSEFPYNEDELSEDNFEMIQQDFPTLDEGQISDNMGLIDDYYSQNLDYVVLTDVAESDELQAKIGFAKKTLWSDGILRFFCIIPNYKNETDIESQTGGATINTKQFSYIRSIIAIWYAKDATAQSEVSVFGHLAYGNTQRDAYRHILLSAYWAKYYYTVSSKSKRLLFSESVGSANENCADDNVDDSMYMDDHNNRIGRNLFQNKCTYKQFRWFWRTVTYGLNVPTEKTLKEEAEDLVNDAYYINKDEKKLTIDIVKQRIIDTPVDKVVFYSKDLK